MYTSSGRASRRFRYPISGRAACGCGGRASCGRASCGCRANQRRLSDIAAEVMKDWRNPYYGAVPYLHAMRELDDIDDAYYADTAREIVQYFLSNATSWRGAKAREIKAELGALLKRRGRGNVIEASPYGFFTPGIVFVMGASSQR